MSPEASRVAAAPSATGTVNSVIAVSRASTPTALAGPTAAAMLRPASVARPVATTTAVAEPATTVVPSYTIEERSAT